MSSDQSGLKPFEAYVQSKLTGEPEPFCPFSFGGYCDMAYVECTTCFEAYKDWHSQLIKRLRRYSQKCITDRLDPDFASAIQEVVQLLEAQLGE